MEPKTDGEWMIQLSGEIKLLTQEIRNIGEKIKDLIETEIKTLKQEAAEMKQWKSEWQGSWTLIKIMGGVITLATGIIAIVLVFK